MLILPDVPNSPLVETNLSIAQMRRALETPVRENVSPVSETARRVADRVLEVVIS